MLNNTQRFPILSNHLYFLKFKFYKIGNNISNEDSKYISFITVSNTYLVTIKTNIKQ